MLIGPATVVTPTEVIADGAVLVDGGQVQAVGRFDALRRQHPDAMLHDAGDRLLTPGLINAHAHLYGLFARGISLKDPPPETFRQVLERIWWRLDRALDGRTVYLSAVLGGIAALR
ncbi:MAG TPA: chlorohydrolase, partial [Symbiobacteriaceae bacterium]|nr:chlorohydrolase [Symbiobacteriaceae bacterium]